MHGDRIGNQVGKATRLVQIFELRTFSKEIGVLGLSISQFVPEQVSSQIYLKSYHYSVVHEGSSYPILHSHGPFQGTTSNADFGPTEKVDSLPKRLISPQTWPIHGKNE